MVRETLSQKRVAELRDIAGELGISGRWRMKKAMLVEAILEARVGPQREDEVEVDDEVDFEVDFEVDGEVEVDDVVELELEDDVEEEDEEVVEPSATEPPPAEPSEIFIDRGPPLPERYPGQRVRVMVRDPRHVFTYWESEDEPEAWEIQAVRGDAVLHSFRTPGYVRHGYLHVPPGTWGRVTLAPVRTGRAAEPVATIAFRTPPAQPSVHEGDVRWVHVDEGVFEARRAEVLRRIHAGEPVAEPMSALPPTSPPGPQEGLVGSLSDSDFHSEPPGFPYERDPR